MNQAVGSVTFIDSSIKDTPIGILTAYSRNQSSMSNGSLILENVNLKNVGIAVQGAGSVTALAGTTGSMTIAAWGQGHIYDGTGSHTAIQGPMPPFSRPSGLLDGQKYYERSKPSYAHIPVPRFLSAPTHDATGNSIVDDSKALQKVINAAASAGKVLFIDAGTYKVTNTLHIPTGSKIIGESYPVIMSSGSYFANIYSPKPVGQFGRPDSIGCVEWSDMVVATQGHQPGAILIEWNLSPRARPPACGTFIRGSAASRDRTSNLRTVLLRLLCPVTGPAEVTLACQPRLSAIPQPIVREA